MRRFAILLLLLFGGLTFAQFGSTGQEIVNCQMVCCGEHGGVWDSSGCDIDYESVEYDDWVDCQEQCIEGVAEEAGWTDGGGDVVCCGSAFILLALMGFVAIRR